MSATEELRRLLDERGVEFGTNETLTDCWTRWVAGKLRCTATEINGEFAFSVGTSTPEQAIAATLGRGTCKLSRGTSGLMHVTTGHCSECGAEVVKGTKDGYRSRYCQWCGAKVVEA